MQTLRLALQVGLTDRQIQGIMGGQARCVLARQDLLDLGPTPPPEQVIAPALERMYVMLVAAWERMLGGQDGGQELLMALDGCAAGADGPGTNGLRRVGRCAQEDTGATSSSASTGGRPDPGQRTTATEVPSVSYPLWSATIPPAMTCLSSWQALHRP